MFKHLNFSHFLMCLSVLSIVFMICYMEYEGVRDVVSQISEMGYYAILILDAVFILVAAIGGGIAALRDANGEGLTILFGWIVELIIAGIVIAYIGTDITTWSMPRVDLHLYNRDALETSVLFTWQIIIVVAVHLFIISLLAGFVVFLGFIGLLIGCAYEKIFCRRSK